MKKSTDQLLAEISNRLHYAGRAAIQAQLYAEELGDDRLAHVCEEAYKSIKVASDRTALHHRAHTVPPINRTYL